MTSQGELSVSFPDIRSVFHLSKLVPQAHNTNFHLYSHRSWKYLRSFEGWAALQHHAVLRAVFKVVPFTSPISTVPKDAALGSQSKPNSSPPDLDILVHLHQGSYFTVLPKELGTSSEDVTPKWYSGNIYDIPRSLPQLVELPPSETGEYQLLVSGDYEVPILASRSKRKTRAHE